MSDGKEGKRPEFIPSGWFAVVKRHDVVPYVSNSGNQEHRRDIDLQSIDKYQTKIRVRFYNDMTMFDDDIVEGSIVYCGFILIGSQSGNYFNYTTRGVYLKSQESHEVYLEGQQIKKQKENKATAAGK